MPGKIRKRASATGDMPVKGNDGKPAKTEERVDFLSFKFPKRRSERSSSVSLACFLQSEMQPLSSMGRERK